MIGKNGLKFLLFLCVTVFVVFVGFHGIGQERRFSIYDISLGLDLNGGVYLVYEATEEEVGLEQMETAQSLIRERLDRKEYLEADVNIEGSHRLRVEIPGIDDVKTAMEEIGQTARLTFVDETGAVLLDGSNIADAKRQYGVVSQNGLAEYYIQLQFTSEGKEKFAQATGDNVGKPIYIMLDGEVISAPVVRAVITDGVATITGGDFTAQSADELSALIRAGALPFDLEVVEMQNISAQLGQSALERSLLAGAVGFVFVVVMMVFLYKVAGIAASWALVFYVSMDIILLSGSGVALTLSSIAGIILSVGMAVDANVVIFERIKEELAAGRTLRSSVDAGFKRAFPAIIDGNVTTLIAAFVLLLLGTGPIRGFAQTLMIGILLSMLTAVFITRKILKIFIGIGIHNPRFYGGAKK